MRIHEITQNVSVESQKTALNSEISGIASEYTEKSDLKEKTYCNLASTSSMSSFVGLGSKSSFSCGRSNNSTAEVIVSSKAP